MTHPTEIIFDIETIPADAAVLQSLQPTFEAPANLKDPEKIAAAIEAKRQAWLDEAALKAERAKVALIGYAADGGAPVILEGREKAMLETWWPLVREWLLNGTEIVGFNSHKFDWPFLLRRSWLVGVVPAAIKRGRYFGDGLVDIAETWNCGVYGDYISLDTLARAMGFNGKTGKGSEFPRLWADGRYDEAKAYLENDLKITAAVWTRMKERR